MSRPAATTIAMLGTPIQTTFQTGEGRATAATQTRVPRAERCRAAGDGLARPPGETATPPSRPLVRYRDKNDGLAVRQKRHEYALDHGLGACGEGQHRMDREQGEHR